MPFCNACDRFYNPNTLDAGGNCPGGHDVAQPRAPEVPVPVPWHFKVLVVALILYLGWRFVEFIAWIT